MYRYGLTPRRAQVKVGFRCPVAEQRNLNHRVVARDCKVESGIGTELGHSQEACNNVEQDMEVVHGIIEA